MSKKLEDTGRTDRQGPTDAVTSRQPASI